MTQLSVLFPEEEHKAKKGASWLTLLPPVVRGRARTRLRVLTGVEAEWGTWPSGHLH